MCACAQYDFFFAVHLAAAAAASVSERWAARRVGCGGRGVQWCTARYPYRYMYSGFVGTLFWMPGRTILPGLWSTGGIGDDSVSYACPWEICVEEWTMCVCSARSCFPVFSGVKRSFPLFVTFHCHEVCTQAGHASSDHHSIAYRNSEFLDLIFGAWMEQCKRYANDCTRVRDVPCLVQGRLFGASCKGGCDMAGPPGCGSDAQANEADSVGMPFCCD